MSPRSAFRLLTSTLARPRPRVEVSRDALDPPPALDWRPALAAGRAFLDWCRDVAHAHAAERALAVLHGTARRRTRRPIFPAQ